MIVFSSLLILYTSDHPPDRLNDRHNKLLTFVVPHSMRDPNGAGGVKQKDAGLHENFSGL
jgi:hypothetical protein